MSIYFWRSGRRSRQVTPLIAIPKVRLLSKMIDGMTSLISIPKIRQLSKMIDGMTSLINIPNILLLQKRQLHITAAVAVRLPATSFNGDGVTKGFVGHFLRC